MIDRHTVFDEHFNSQFDEHFNYFVSIIDRSM